HVDDVGDLVAHVVQRTHGRLAARTRALDAHFQRLHAVVQRILARLLGGDLGCERGRLARAAETRAARGRPRQRVALAVGDGDDGVVERRVHVGDAIGDDALDLLLGFRGSWLGHVCSLLPDGLARTLAGTGIGPGALAAQGKAAAMAQAAIAGQVHQALDRDADFAAQVAFDRVLGDLGTEAFDLRLGQVADPGRRRHAGGLADLLRTGTANAVDALQAHPDVLLGRQVDAGNTRHDAVSKLVVGQGTRPRRSELEILARFRVVWKPRPSNGPGPAWGVCPCSGDGPGLAGRGGGPPCPARALLWRADRPRATRARNRRPGRPFAPFGAAPVGACPTSCRPSGSPSSANCRTGATSGAPGSGR